MPMDKLDMLFYLESKWRVNLPVILVGLSMKVHLFNWIGFGLLLGFMIKMGLKLGNIYMISFRIMYVLMDCLLLRVIVLLHVHYHILLKSKISLEYAYLTAKQIT